MKRNQERHVPIAIIGIGCIFAKSEDLQAFLHVLMRGISGITDPPPTHQHLNSYLDTDPKKPDHIYCNRGGYLPEIDFDPTEFGIPPHVLEATDTSQLLGLLTARRALEDAGYGENGNPFDRSKTSVILGVTGTQELAIPLGSRLGHPIWRKALAQSGVSKEQSEAVIERISNAYVSWQENSFPGLLGNVVAGRIANRLDLGGTNCVVDAACASSMGAIQMAILELATGRSDMAITGGIDTINDAFMHMCFSKTQILSGSGDIRPFSENADGTVLGEGIGLIVLKRLADARKDNDRIYAVIKGIGSASDGKSQSIYAPRPEGQSLALKRAYEFAGIDPAGVELAEAHGTGTRVGDQVEFSSLCDVFGGQSHNGNRCALGSVKSNIGHTKAAAGTAGLIKAAMSVYHKMLPPTLKAEQPDSRLDIEHSPFYINKSLRPWIKTNGQPRRAGVSAFGFGGSNFHVVLEEYESHKTEPSWDGSVELAAFSGNNDLSLKEQLQTWLNQFGSQTGRCLTAQLARNSRALFRSEDPCRLIVVLDDAHDAGAVETCLRKALEVLNTSGQEGLSNSSICIGRGNCPGDLAFIFPGQGSQYVGMGRDLICCFPGSLEAFQDAANCIRIEPSLTEAVFPRNSATNPANESVLRQTRIAQPAIGAVSMAMYEALAYFGIEAQATCGHSYGELVALHAANWISRPDLWKLSAARGRLMAQAGKAVTDAGSMLAVQAPLAELEQTISALEDRVVLANRNSPHQGVLSGTSRAIEEAEAACRQKGWKTVRLPVAAAFHSPLVAAAQEPFAKIVADTPINPGSIRVMSNTSGTPYPLKAGPAGKLLAGQLACPVDFRSNIEHLYDQGVRTFVEVGPKNILTRLVCGTLAGRACHALAVDRSTGSRFGLVDLAETLAQLAALGYPVRLDRWEKPVPNERKPRMIIPLCGANYRREQNSLPRAASHTTILPPKNACTDDCRKNETAKQAPQPPGPATAAAPAGQTSVQSFSRPVAKHQQELSTRLHEHPKSEHMKSDQKEHLRTALAAVQQGLASLQSLHAHTAQAHQKFLETQAEAGRTLQHMMQSAQQLASSSLGLAPMIRSQGSVPRFETAAQNQPDTAANIGFCNKPACDIADPSFRQPIVAPVSNIIKTQSADLQVPPPAQLQAVAHNRVPAAADNSKTIEQALLQIVSDLTGYPQNMLGLDMDIEADLGIDSIKRVEILSALEEKVPDLPKITPDLMGTLKTLGQIAEYLLGADQPPGASHESALQGAEKNGPSGRLPIEQTLLQIVSDLTGYPQDMLGLEMDIEADLGIDSIKRVEILSALEERIPDLPKITPDLMGTLKTLGQIAVYLLDGNNAADAVQAGQSGLDPVAAQAGSAADTQARSNDLKNDKGVQKTLLRIVSDLTGYPQDMLGLEMDIEADLGIDSIKRVEILSALEEKLPDLPKITPDLMGTLKTLGQITDFLTRDIPSVSGEVRQTPEPAAVETLKLAENRPHTIQRYMVEVVPAGPAGAPEPSALPPGHMIGIVPDDQGVAQALVKILASMQLQAEILHEPGDMHADAALAGLVLFAPIEPCKAFRWARACAAGLKKSAGRGFSFLATVSRLDGSFGFSESALQDPIQGALAGLVKTAAFEWPEVRCLAMDVEKRWLDCGAAAEAIATELLQTVEQPFREIGLAPGCRVRLQLTPAPIHTGGPLDLKKEDVVIVTGGARGVTSAAALALVRHAPCTLALLGRSAAPEPEPTWMRGLQEERAIKKAILEHMENGSASPKRIEKLYSQWINNRRTNQMLESLADAQLPARYYSVDIRDSAAVAKTIEAIRKELGPVKALIHGAGVLSDRLIIDKDDDQFDLVFETKVNGLQNMLSAVQDDALRYMVIFSSVSGRLGNSGQADYAMANEAINKIARQQALQRPDCKICSINWGPWDGGMVTASLKRNFIKNGISLIPIQQGAAMLIAEMASAKTEPVEVVIGGLFNTRHSNLPAKPVDPNNDKTAIRIPTTLCLAARREIDIDRYPVLQSHLLNGRPVVPLALITEWLAHSALHANPGLALHGIDQLRLLSGITLEHNKKMIRLLSGKAKRNGHYYEVEVQIRDEKNSGREVIHSSAKAILTNALPEPPVFLENGHFKTGTYNRSMEDIYERILFHGRELRGIQKVIQLSKKGMTARLACAPAPELWMQEPLRSRWISDPLVLDCAFQMAIVWCFEQTGNLSLPSYAASYRQYRERFPVDGVTAVLEVHKTTNRKIFADFTFLDDQKRVVACLNGYEAIMDENLMKAFRAA